jgi:hypothetical protein
MAAEMSTGALCLAHLYKRKPPVSMLVVKVDGEYFKKATGKTVFVCEDGAGIKNAIEEAVETKEPKIFMAKSVEEIKRVWLLLSFISPGRLRLRAKKERAQEKISIN